MTRITVNLRDDERRGLLDLAKKERRDPRDQAAVLIRDRLHDLGILANGDQTHKSAQPQPAAEAAK